MELRGFQQEAADVFDARFRGEPSQRKRFVGAILPTGGGKSFLFMDQLEKEMFVFNETEEINDVPPLSHVNVKFFAPLTGIIDQTKANILEFIVLPNYIKCYTNNGKTPVTEENVDEIFNNILKRLADSSKLSGKARKEFLASVEAITVPSDLSPEEVLREKLLKVLVFISDKRINTILETELPNVTLNCYQNDNQLKVDEQNIEDWAQTSLVCFDEAHKTAADTWSVSVEALMKNERLKNCKFMAITATPERDVDGIDAMDRLAVNCGEYSVEEIRKKDYLACNITLVEALEKGIVVKPRVQSFDCMLDQTTEYKKVREYISYDIEDENGKKKKNKSKLDKTSSSSRNGKYTDKYHMLLMRFFNMCKLCGKLDFLEDYLKEHSPNSREYEVLRVLYRADAEGKKVVSEDQIIQKYRTQDLESIKKLILDIDTPGNELHELYEKLRQAKIQEIIESVGIKDGSKYICFTPLYSAEKKSEVLMPEYQQKMMKMLNLPENQVFIIHTNKDIVPDSESKKNLSDFRRSKGTTQVIVAMNMINEGLHVGQINGEFMFREYVDGQDTGAKGNEKEEPRIIFLQQVGRSIHAVNPNKPETEVPVIFDVACNFMRHNGKLNDMFELSPAQEEFKEVADECDDIYFDRGNELTQPPKEHNLARLMTVIKVLNENGIDVSKISVKTSFKDLPIPDDIREKVLDEIFVKTNGIRLKPDYNIGVKLQSAREAFWHRERENKSSASKGTKKLYNSETDKFFQRPDLTFENLYSMGFFDDIEPNCIDKNGFIIGGCANIDRFYGYNVNSGTKYGLVTIKRNGVLEYWYADINGFTENGFNIYTQTQYDPRFFKFDEKTGKWVNLKTGEDRDQLGYNHDGIMVQEGKLKRVGFDREGRYHKKLLDGSYSRETSSYDENGRDAFGFDKDSSSPIRKFYRVKNTGRYEHESGLEIDYDGRDIEGFDANGFDKDGINKATSSRYSRTGDYYIHDGKDNVRVPYPIKSLLLNPEGTHNSPTEIRKMLTEWFVLYYSNEEQINNPNIGWLSKIITSIETESGQSFDDLLRRRCKEFKVPCPLETYAQEQMAMSEIFEEKIRVAMTRQFELRAKYDERRKEIEDYIKENGGR